MNAEVAEHRLGSLWLQQNTTIEQITRKYVAETDLINRQIRDINKHRQVMQTKAYPELAKLVHKRELSLQRKWRCQTAYSQLNSELCGKYKYPSCVFTVL